MRPLQNTDYTLFVLDPFVAEYFLCEHPLPQRVFDVLCQHVGSSMPQCRFRFDSKFENFSFLHLHGRFVVELRSVEFHAECLELSADVLGLVNP